MIFHLQLLPSAFTLRHSPPPSSRGAVYDAAADRCGAWARFRRPSDSKAKALSMPQRSDSLVAHVRRARSHEISVRAVLESN